MATRTNRLSILMGVALTACLCLCGPVRGELGEVRSELADFATERDAVYLRPVGRAAETGRASGYVGPGEWKVRFEALVRGRSYPGRWTMLELDLQPVGPAGRGQTVEVVWSNGQSRFRVEPKSRPGEVSGQDGWTRLRLPLGEKAGDLTLRVAQAKAGAGIDDEAGGVRLGRLRLVDDRKVYWSQGWPAPGVRREAGMLRIGPGVAVPEGQFAIAELGGVRALVTDAAAGTAARDGKVTVAQVVGAVYASGGRFGRLAPAAEKVERPGVEMDLSDDQGQLDRTSRGDENGDGFNETRGAFVVRVVGRRLTLNLRPGQIEQSVAIANAPSVASARSAESLTLEFHGLPAGEPRVLWEGQVVSTWQRESSGVLVVQLPGGPSRETRLDVSVEGK